MILLMVLIGTRVGDPLFRAWMTPVVVLYDVSRTLTFAFMLPSPFRLGF